MAEWVLKGNLKGPQGDPGQDAQLPAGGTEGQVLTKTSGGEAWADVPQPDMTGVVKYTGIGLTADGEAVSLLAVGDFEAAPFGMATIHGGSTGTGVQGYGGASNSQLFTIGADNSSASVTLDCGDHNFYATVTNESTEVRINSKSVSSITDAISDSPAGKALVTDKAVADYLTSRIATDEEFDSVFGL